MSSKQPLGQDRSRASCRKQLTMQGVVGVTFGAYRLISHVSGAVDGTTELVKSA